MGVVLEPVQLRRAIEVLGLAKETRGEACSQLIYTTNREPSDREEE